MLVMLTFICNRLTNDPTAVKSDSSLLFKKLTELNSRHRVIMTGVNSLYCLIIISSLTSAIDSTEQ